MPVAQIQSVRPVILPARAGGIDVLVRVTAPTSGTDLPVVVFSHGHGESMDAYAPLVDAWAEAGIVVVSPTHADSLVFGIGPEDPRVPEIWRMRIDDIGHVVDRLEGVLAAMPGLPERVDVSRIAVAGHSWGAVSASALLGAGVIGADATVERWTDPQVGAGVFIAMAGTGDDLTPFAAENFPFMRPDFSQMAAPALLIAGGRDQSRLSTRGADWWRDGYDLAPGPKALLTLAEAEHTMGGIAGISTHEISDPDPERVAMIAEMTAAYLLCVLEVDPAPWAGVLDEFGGLGAGAPVRVELK